MQAAATIQIAWRHFIENSSVIQQQVFAAEEDTDSESELHEIRMVAGDTRMDDIGMGARDIGMDDIGMGAHDIGMDDIGMGVHEIGMTDIGMGAPSKVAEDHTRTSAPEDSTKIGMGEMIRRRIAEQHAQFYGWENDTHE